jgi:hypothetical protein
MNQRSTKRFFRFAVFAAIAVMGGMFLGRCQRYSIPAGDQSLTPTYPGGTRVVCRKIDPDDPLERDLDVVYAMEKDGVMHARFGRVRGLAGDEIGTDDDGRLTVNGTPIGPIAIRGAPMGRVPAGKVFILAVNPQEITYPDSRRLGFIDRSSVRARILSSWGIGR